MDNTQSSGIPPKKKPEDYRFGKLIGEGSFSSVYVAKEVKNGEEFAIKVCSKQQIIRERKTELIKREKDVMAILSANRNPVAPFFVRLYATFHDAERLYFVMTYARGGELLKCLYKVGSFDIPCCKFYCAELILGLAHLHNLRIVHRDIKPENILLDHRGHILITDFGSSKLLEKEKIEKDKIEENETSSATQQQSKEADENADQDGKNNKVPSRGIRSNSFVGTAQYVSPEVLSGNYSVVGPPADLWAFGCVLYQLVSGLPPFHGPTEYLIFQKIMKLDYKFPNGFDNDAKDLVEKLLKLDHNERLGANDVEKYASIQSHPFFIGTDWEKLHSQEPPKNSLSLSLNEQEQILKNEVPDTIEPGFNSRIMAERALREDNDFLNLGWSDGKSSTNANAIDSDEDDDEEETVCLSTLLIRKSSSENAGINSSLTSSSPSNNKSTTIKNEKSSPEKCMNILRRSKNLIPLNENERAERLSEQILNNPWNKVVNGNLILKQGIISKRKGLFARRRMFLLTEGPHLYYCCPNRMRIKGEIPWSRSLNPDPKDFRHFFVHTPNRTYILDDPEGYAHEWCKAINELRHHLYGDVPPKPRIPQ